MKPGSFGRDIDDQQAPAFGAAPIKAEGKPVAIDGKRAKGKKTPRSREMIELYLPRVEVEALLTSVETGIAMQPKGVTLKKLRKYLNDRLDPRSGV